MVGFISKPAAEEEQGEVNQDSNTKNFDDPLDFFDPKIEDFSLIDSFLDFDAINWLEDNPNLSSTELGFFESDMEMIPEGSNEETPVGDQITCGSEPIVVKSDPFSDGSESIVNGSEPVVSGGSEQIGSGSVCLHETKVDGEKLKTGEGLTCSIEEEMGKVSLAADGDAVARSEPKSDGSESDSESPSESDSESESGHSTSSSSSSSDDESDEEEEKEKLESKAKIRGKMADEIASECEEGEIKSVDVEESDGKTNEEDEDEDDDDDADAMIAWSDAEEEYGSSAHTREPIRSKNELKDLPSVPRVDVTLEPHHTMLPVGVVLSMIDTRVIVEGVEKHNPLNEGSILWITETRAPLGIVDEIFGPVKNPYYVVRYNAESEVPARIHQGTLISFVAEFADHVLNNKDLYRKGYDASGENDEEMLDEFEFSDDEKEAEYKKMQRMTKRGMNEQKPGNMTNNKKKMKNKDGGRQMNKHTTHKAGNEAAQPLQPSNPNQKHFLPSTPSLDHGNSLVSPARGQNFTGGSGLVPSFQQMPQAGGFVQNGMPNNTIFSGGPSQNGLLWLWQNNQQRPYPVPMPNQMLMRSQIPMRNPMSMQNQMHVSNPMLFQQQFGPGQISLPNVVIPGGQANSNFFAGPSSGPWPPLAGQNCFFQTAFGMGFQGQPSNGAINADQRIFPRVSNADNSHNSAIGSEAPQPFSVGAPPSRGRRPYRGGRGHFGRGTGRQQS